MSEGTIRAIIEDNHGFMWFGTEDGLNKYDGYRFTVYKTNPKDGYTVNSNNIKCLFNDSKGNLWIGTRHGLNLYDPIQDKFFNANSNKYKALNSIRGDIEAITEDASGDLWLVSSTNGLVRIKSLDEPSEEFHFSKDLSGIFVSIEHDGKDHFLIGTNDGLLRFDKRRKTFEDLRNYVRGQHVRNIFVDGQNKIWMATTKGLKLARLSLVMLRGL